MDAYQSNNDDSRAIKQCRSELEELLDELDLLVLSNSTLASGVGSIDKVREGMLELNSMIGMEEVKRTIAKQIRFLLLRNIMAGHNAKSPMLHMAFFGPPGVGKTKACTCIAKICTALGLVKARPIPSGFGSTTTSDRDVDYRMVEALQQQVTRLQHGIRGYTDRVGVARSMVGHIIDDMKGSIIDLDECLSTGKRSRDGEPSNTSPRKRRRINPHVVKEIAVDSFNRNRDDLREIQNSLPDRDLFIHHNDMTTCTKPTNDDPYVVIACRGDFVAEYTGQTVPKTLRFLNKNRGKFIFINEAYTLMTGSNDTFGLEAITTINQWMDTHSDETGFCFDGYKDKLRETIFKFQPELERRCRWVFEVDGYTPNQLASLFRQQLLLEGWILDDKIDIDDWFRRNAKDFIAFGGDTETVASLSIQEQVQIVWSSMFVVDGLSRDQVKSTLERRIGLDALNKAHKLFCVNRALGQRSESSTTYDYMYL